MSFRDTVLMAACAELAAPVHWAQHEERILDYFRVSTGKEWTKAAALEISWCSYFVHWVLVKGGMQPLPAAGTYAELQPKGGSIGRYLKRNGGPYQDYPVIQKKYAPRPGDMYLKPNPNNHIGFISDVRPGAHGRYDVKTIDGNSGPGAFSALFDMSHGRKIGYGFIYQPNGWRQLTDDCSYVKLCDES